MAKQKHDIGHQKRLKRKRQREREAVTEQHITRSTGKRAA